MSNNKSKPRKSFFKKSYFLILLAALSLVIYLIYAIENKEELNDMSKFECLFCNITNGSKIQTKFEFENDEFVILKDINPASTYHYLAIPKQHISSIKVLNKSHIGLVQRMENGLKQILDKEGANVTTATIGFHIPPFISQKHLHLHGISPPSGMSFFSRISFFTPSFWFTTANDVIQSLKRAEL